MRNKKWEMDFSPIEVDGASSVDTLYSKAYLRHLFHADVYKRQQSHIQHMIIIHIFAGAVKEKDYILIS